MRKKEIVQRKREGRKTNVQKKQKGKKKPHKDE